MKRSRRSRKLKKISRSIKKSILSKSRRKFGNKLDHDENIITVNDIHDLKKDPLFNMFSLLADPKELLNLFAFTKKVSDNTFKNKPDESTKLGLIENIQSKLIWFYRNRINDFIDNLTPAQIVSLSDGKFNTEISNKILYNINPPKINDSKNVSILDNLDNPKLLFLQSAFAKPLINNIKQYIKSLSNTQLILLANGKYDLNNSMINAILHTKYPTKTNKENLKLLKKV